MTLWGCFGCGKVMYEEVLLQGQAKSRWSVDVCSLPVPIEIRSTERLNFCGPVGLLICKMLNNHIVISQVYLEENPVFLKCFGFQKRKKKKTSNTKHYYHYYYNLFEQPFPCQNSGIITLQWRSDYSGKEMALGKDCHTQLLWSVVGSIGL